ncbi:MAG: hypothetical protein JWO68_1446 [Actinomycetia bacterium]|nr:hypothetical protein [Actinomycetes bacterium]
MPAGGVPSDEAPAVLAHGRTDVRIGILSMSARSPEGLDARYLEWHGLDHLPEQHRIGGVRAGTRWVSTPACRAARAASAGRYDAVDHVVQYLFADPLTASLETFFTLGADLGAAGRMPMRLPSVELAGWRLTGTRAAGRVLAGADVLPWRPARGAFLLVEQGAAAAADDLVAVAGVAGAWTYEGTGSLHDRLADTDGLHLTVCSLDDDPVVAAHQLVPALDRRWASGATTPLLAAPFESVVPWAWDRSLP